MNPTVTHVDFTDHCLVASSLQCVDREFPDNNTRTHCRRRWPTNISDSRLSDALQKQMNLFGTMNGLDNMWSDWKDKFTQALDEVSPKVTTVHRRRQRCPWMTPRLLNLIHKQKSLYRKVLKSNKQGQVAVKNHCHLRNLTSNMYRCLKNEYFQNRFSQYRNSPKQFWSAINYITGRQDQRLPPSVNLTDLASHFRHLLTQPQSKHNLLGPDGPDVEHSLCEVAFVSMAEVEKLLKGLISKASGPDNISSAELKVSAKCIAGKIATIFSESLRSGDLPTEFRTGHVIPLLKPGKTDTTNPASYRGTTLTPVLSKVLERVVYNQVTAFLNETADQQCGFRKGYSFVDLLTVAADDWLLARDQKLSTAIAFLDLSKAFDNVRNQQLLIFLERFHIGGTVLRWFSNYLTERSHRVVVNDQASDEFICTKGVPQGSVLGPLLFNLYVAGLHSIAARYNVSLPAFADDMSLYCWRKAMEYACSDVSKALTSISSELKSRGAHSHLRKDCRNGHPSKIVKDVCGYTVTEPRVSIVVPNQTNRHSTLHFQTPNSLSLHVPRGLSKDQATWRSCYNTMCTVHA